MQNFLTRIKSHFKNAKKEKKSADRGIFLFENTSEVISAETTLKKFNWHIKVMGPPPEIQKGCDLVIEFPLIEQMNLLRTLKDRDIVPLETIPVTGPLLKPVDIFQTKDFGGFLMCRAANMKITICKKTQTIVNISGGGCPDVPYLAAELCGKKLCAAPPPLQLGHTLCGYALEMAYQELKRQCWQ